MNVLCLPGLGGFIVRDSPCNFTADKSMIKPAFRNLFFNPHLTQNDGLIVPCPSKRKKHEL